MTARLIHLTIQLCFLLWLTLFGSLSDIVTCRSAQAQRTDLASQTRPAAQTFRICRYACRRDRCPRAQPMCRLPRTRYQRHRHLPQMPNLFYTIYEQHHTNATLTDLEALLKQRATACNQGSVQARIDERRLAWRMLRHPFVKTHGPWLQFHLALHLLNIHNDYDAQRDMRIFAYLRELLLRDAKRAPTHPRYLDIGYVRSKLRHYRWHLAVSHLRNLIAMFFPGTAPHPVRRHKRLTAASRLLFPFCWCEPKRPRRCNQKWVAQQRSRP